MSLNPYQSPREEASSDDVGGSVSWAWATWGRTLLTIAAALFLPVSLMAGSFALLDYVLRLTPSGRPMILIMALVLAIGFGVFLAERTMAAQRWGRWIALQFLIATVSLCFAILFPPFPPVAPVPKQIRNLKQISIHTEPSETHNETE
jgi:hypothetical protein